MDLTTFKLRAKAMHLYHEEHYLNYIFSMWQACYKQRNVTSKCPLCWLVSNVTVVESNQHLTSKQEHWQLYFYFFSQLCWKKILTDNNLFICTKTSLIAFWKGKIPSLTIHLENHKGFNVPRVVDKHKFKLKKLFNHE